MDTAAGGASHVRITRTPTATSGVASTATSKNHANRVMSSPPSKSR